MKLETKEQQDKVEIYKEQQDLNKLLSLPSKYFSKNLLRPKVHRFIHSLPDKLLDQYVTNLILATRTCRRVNELKKFRNKGALLIDSPKYPQPIEDSKPKLNILSDEINNPLYYEQERKQATALKRFQNIQFYSSIYNNAKLYIQSTIEANTQPPRIDPSIALAYILYDMRRIKDLYIKSIRHCANIYNYTGNIYFYLYPTYDYCRILSKRDDKTLHKTIREFLLKVYKGDTMMNDIKHVISFKNNLDINGKTALLELRTLKILNPLLKKIDHLIRKKGKIFTHTPTLIQLEYTYKTAEYCIYQMILLLNEVDHYIDLSTSMLDITSNYKKLLYKLEVDCPFAPKQLGEFIITSTQLQKELTGLQESKIYQEKLNKPYTYYANQGTDNIILSIIHMSQSSKGKHFN